MEAFKHEYPLAMMARLLQVSTSGLYQARHSHETPRAQENQRLKVLIEAQFNRHKRRYGSPRIYRALRDAGETCGRHRVTRLMHQMGLKAVYRNRHTPRTNRIVQLGSAAPNLVERQFEVGEPNQVWLGDITQLPVREGWLYLAANMDLFSRRIVGWSLSSRYDVNLVINALDHATDTRQPGKGLVVHTDQGSQYRAGDYRAYLRQQEMKPSMSRKGDCWDNAPMESFFKSMKTELGETRSWHSAQAVTRLGAYIEHYYNSERIHSSVGYLSPVQYEKEHGAI